MNTAVFIPDNRDFRIQRGASRDVAGLVLETSSSPPSVVLCHERREAETLRPTV